MKSYTELMTLPTFEERFEYLQDGIIHSVGAQTFGSHRYVNQMFYRSRLWKNVRAGIIVRDGGCDLAIPNRVIPHSSMLRVHHINPLTPEMFDDYSRLSTEPENLICISFNTHNLLTYGGEAPKQQTFVERTPYDHAPWRKG